jgi:hypothetical protein
MQEALFTTHFVQAQNCLKTAATVAPNLAATRQSWAELARAHIALATLVLQYPDVSFGALPDG